MKALSIRQPWAELILSGRKTYELRMPLPTGAIVGLIDVVDCVPFDLHIAEELRAAGIYFRKWPEARYAWVLANPRRLPRPVPYKGMLGLFSISTPL